MDQYSFHGPFAYRWIDDVPVERIDLRSGERLAMAVISGGLSPAIGPPPPCATPDPNGDGDWQGPQDTEVRASMATWN